MRPDTRSDYGQRLFDARTKAELTQPQLAKAVGLAQSTIAGLEKNGQGSSKTPQIAAACGVSAEWLATGEDKAVSAPWPLLGIVSPTEWAQLPAEVRDDVRASAEHFISRHRQRVGTGKSDDSRRAA